MDFNFSLFKYKDSTILQMVSQLGVGIVSNDFDLKPFLRVWNQVFICVNSFIFLVLVSDDFIINFI